LLATFVLASTLLSLATGPDNIFVLLQSALHGRKGGMLITLGLCTGLIVHTTLMALGVAALLMISAAAFLLLKLLGAAYLFYLAAEHPDESLQAQACDLLPGFPAPGLPGPRLAK
jgi:threonine/homoserine/homoserine lactone efflux protein